MNDSKPARTANRAPRSMTLIAMAMGIAVLLGILGYQSWTAAHSLATDNAGIARSLPATPAPVARQAGDDRRRDRPPDRPPLETGRGDRPGAPGPPDAAGVPGEADGAVPAGVTVFDDDLPAVANLDPDLLGALRLAATDAAIAGVTLYVNSGWRSPKYQDQLLHEAISVYGSAEEAARWVAAADTSAHVSGDAIDLGPDEATAWLSEHGAMYGLCQIYTNEPWHFELRPEAVDHGCPPLYADPTHDPRMQR